MIIAIMQHKCSDILLLNQQNTL